MSTELIVYRCRDCKHFVIGRNRRWQDPNDFKYVCKMKPKSAANSLYFGHEFYSAQPVHKACEKFELK